jgi:hypothetical protein
MLSYPPKAGLQYIFGDHDEPEMLVQRAVPGNVDEGSEGECRISRFDGPRVHRFEQILTESPTLVVRKDADLLNVSVSIYDIDNDVANRSITLVDGNPTASAARVSISLSLEDSVERDGRTRFISQYLRAYEVPAGCPPPRPIATRARRIEPENRALVP